MNRHLFCIPRDGRYWRGATPTDSDLQRLIASVRRCYPEVEFQTCDHPPRFQRYARGSENDRIRQTLESMSAVDLDRQYEHHLDDRSPPRRVD